MEWQRRIELSDDSLDEGGYAKQVPRGEFSARRVPGMRDKSADGMMSAAVNLTTGKRTSGQWQTASPAAAARGWRQLQI